VILHQQVAAAIKFDDAHVAGECGANAHHSTRAGREVVDEETRTAEAALKSAHEAAVGFGVDREVALHDRHAA